MCYKVLHGLVDLSLHVFYSLTVSLNSRKTVQITPKLPVVFERDKNYISNH